MEESKANKILNSLIEDGINTAEGSISFDLMGVKVDVDKKSGIGNLIQEWLGEWLKSKNIYFREDDNTQVFPDFYLDESNKINLLELKTFDFEESPNFDVANFDAYIRSLRNDAYRLDADYLIMGYTLSAGVIMIKELWLKKVWEITCPSERFAIRSQVKQDRIVNIRPYNFKTNSSSGFQPFSSRREFVNALKKTLNKYKNEEYGESWFNEVKNSYREHTNQSL